MNSHLRDHHDRPQQASGRIHDRMPPIIAPGDYVRWPGDESDPHDLMQSYPAEPMRIWPISTRVNKPDNDDPSILEPIELILV
jgi:putative SOS response-associated peptidase YedK